jgi:hypothetical protein
MARNGTLTLQSKRNNSRGEMEITIEIFKSVIDQTLVHKAGMHKPENVAHRLAKFYCRPMTTMGNCPNECKACKPRIEEGLKKIDPSKVKSPYAIFMWQIRNLHAQSAEARPKQKERRNVFGEKIKTDVFAELMEQYG